MSEKISESHVYDGGYIAIGDIKLEGLPKKLTVDGYGLSLKSEFHISLVCIKRLAPMIDSDRVSELGAEIIELFKDFIKTTPLSEFELTGDYRLVKRAERVTVVAMVVVPGIEALFKMLSQKYKMDFPVQPTHITIYCLQPEVGIGLLSEEEVKKESVQVKLDLAVLKA